jgi:metallo-beta-lactamase class B
MILLLAALLAQTDATSRSWNAPVEPFHLTAHLSYVGASEVTSYAIETSQGLIVIDGGFVETAPQIERNLAKLGYAVRNVKVLLSSHAHFDHAGGLADLKKATGATLYVSAADAAALARGGKDDFAFGDRFPFPPVRADRIVRDHDRVQLGEVTLTANLTPGHTRGCTTWAGRIDGRDVVFVCSTRAPGYRLVGNEKYPGIVEDYRRTFARLRSLRCDIFLASHGSFFGLAEKMRKGPSAFVDPDGYRAFVDSEEAAFEREVARQKGFPSTAVSR